MDRLAEHYLNLGVLATYGPGIVAGLWVTLATAVATVVLGITLGLLMAVVLAARVPVLRQAVVVWIEVFRTLPQLAVIIVLYFGLPYADITLSPFWATVGALGAVLSAFAAEIFRSSIQALPPGQWDAARALGFRFRGTFFLVILPQAVRLAIPLLTNRAIAITKGTALGTAVSLPELLGRAQSAMAIAANPSPLTLAAALYLVLFLPLVVASRWLEATRVTPR
ncbi:amino acid ABC transporter permease [Paracraurococcus lichenis]|uniref:Amino acid ABC transporter permease n=1 Tax=Paracraurococcus lichenis TaxID=3064888 RepID=A0ABT9DUH0_9PROT|nr:amino acid ABC transporter permease [Paracraurococcus sp. LOR1-02]MDO9707445.1 amino acid ABC transporter permease [Paracraurococcus sp. LOR1-02]